MNTVASVMSEPLCIRRGALVIDLARCRVLLNTRPIVPTYTEYLLLVYLATHQGYPVSKRRLLEEGLGRHDPGGLRMVDEHIRHLKLKLERYGWQFIEEVAGAGYRFIPQDGSFGDVT